MFGKKEPINELDQRKVNLAQQRKQLAAHSAERERLKAGAQAATAPQERAHAALSRIISDPMSYATTPEAELAAAKQALVSTAKAATQAAAELAAHESEHGDLGERGKQLLREEHYLAQALMRAADREDAAELVDLGCRMAAVSTRMDQRRRDAGTRWPKAEVISAGRTIAKGAELLPDVTPPFGLFNAVRLDIGPRSVWTDHCLRGIGRVWPELLPADQAEAILAQIAAEKVVWYPYSIQWNTEPQRRFGS